MSKKYLLALMLLLGTTVVNAEIQSPIYTDDIGRAHFLGKGGYSSVRGMQMNGVQADFVNDAVNKYSNQKEDVDKKADAEKKDDVKKESDVVKKADGAVAKFESKKQNGEKADVDITSVINEKKEHPVSRYKSTFTYQKGAMDASYSNTYTGTNIPSGVNDSKTLYTDELGRLHFFGKANKITETSTQK